MIGFLQGRLLRSTPQRLLIDVGGVGYEVQVPLSTYYEIERRGPAEPVRLHVHTHVREDELSLFGFATEREKQLFERLIGVSGIGPRLAQVALSGMSAEDLVAALAAGDVPRLTTIPGVGKKTAERMVLELKDRVRDLAAASAGAPAARATPSPGDDLVAALVNLGYKEAHAERAVAETRREQPDAVFHELLRAALKRLSRA